MIIVEGICGLLECSLGGFVVGRQRNLGTRLGRLDPGLAASGIKDRADKLGTDRVGSGISFQQAVQFLADDATATGQRERGEPQRLRHANFCGRRLKRLIGSG